MIASSIFAHDVVKNVIGKAGRCRLGWQVSPTQIGRFGGDDFLEIFPVAQRQGLELMWRTVSYSIRRAACHSATVDSFVDSTEKGR